MIWLLIYLVSYIIGVLGWCIIVLWDLPYIKTIEDLVDEVCETPAFIPVANIITLIGVIICSIYVLIMRFIYKILP